MINIANLEREVMEFESNIVASTELINTLNKIIEQIDKSNKGFDENLMLLKQYRDEAEKSLKINGEVVVAFEKTIKSTLDDHKTDINASLEKEINAYKKLSGELENEIKSNVDRLLSNENNIKLILDENYKMIENMLEQKINRIEKSFNFKLLFMDVGICVCLLLGILGIVL